MCGRFTVLTREELADVVEGIRRRRPSSSLADGRGSEASSSRGQARPGCEVDAIVHQASDLAVQQFVWGFEVPWSRRPVINTRLESALGGTAMWQGPIRDGRCILPAATFFEPLVADESAGESETAKVKQSYEFSRCDGFPLLIAGVGEAGRISVVTTQPNADVSPIHPRMPLVLAFEEAPIWLEGSLGDIAALANRSEIRLNSLLEYKRQSNPSQLSLF